MRSIAGIAVPLCLAATMSAAAAADFRFESITDLEEMHRELERRVPLGTAHESARATFVEQGKATLYVHPQRNTVEKYVYDINLCEIYVWRWNISANYDPEGRLTQIFINGEPIHTAGDAARVPAKKPGAKEESIVKAWRPRPEASKGESKLAYLVYDLDAGSDDVDDEFVAGAGPSRADPNDLGVVHAYEVERWRSIFDDEPAAAVVPYAGECRTD
jgi:hypothetical protein